MSYNRYHELYEPAPYDSVSQVGRSRSRAPSHAPSRASSRAPSRAPSRYDEGPRITELPDDYEGTHVSRAPIRYSEAAPRAETVRPRTSRSRAPSPSGSLYAARENDMALYAPQPPEPRRRSGSVSYAPGAFELPSRTRSGSSSRAPSAYGAPSAHDAPALARSGSRATRSRYPPPALSRHPNLYQPTPRPSSRSGNGDAFDMSAMHNTIQNYHERHGSTHESTTYHAVHIRTADGTELRYAGQTRGRSGSNTHLNFYL